jgi:hypothetical protein
VDESLEEDGPGPHSTGIDQVRITGHRPQELRSADATLGDHGVGGAQIGDRLGSWTPLVNSPIVDAITSWDRLEIGPSIRADGLVVAPARSVRLPTALRVDFEAGSAWFVAAIPQLPAMESVFIPGDEIMVVFSAERMRSMGYVDPEFVV